jgi:signal peptidase
MDFEFHNGGLLPVLVVLEPASSGTAVDPDRAVLGRGDRVNATLTASVPDETGVYARHVRESRYILVLPPAVVGALHAVHPLVALLAIDLVVAAFVLAVAVGVFGTGQLRLRSGPGDTVVGRKIERTFKRWR